MKLLTITVLTFCIAFIIGEVYMYSEMEPRIQRVTRENSALINATLNCRAFTAAIINDLQNLDMPRHAGLIDEIRISSRATNVKLINTTGRGK